MTLNAWGRLPFAPVSVARPRDPAALRDAIAAASQPGLAFGNGRSYGDVCLNSGGPLWVTRGLDHFLGFDDITGVLHCEAGVTLQDINWLALPRGWFLPVTPGTQFATIGGAVANDVHGKNHHRRGSIGSHIRALHVLRTDGSALHCTPDDNSGLFAATIGGLGLTGVIASIEIQLLAVKGEWLDVENIAFDNLDDFFALAANSEADWEYTVSWIDCLANGRGIFSRANHSTQALSPPASRKPARVPFTPPLSLINSLSLRVFNPLYFHLHKQRQGRATQHYAPFFYPLDNILKWNRLYGPKGFYQYQSVVPPATARDATRAMLQAIAAAGSGSPLAVLKTFGNNPSPGLLSFPMEGTHSRWIFRTRARARSTCSNGSTPSCAKPEAASIRPRTRACRAICS